MRSDSEYAGGVPVVVSLADEDVLHPTERPAPAAFVLPRTTMLISVVRDLLLLFCPYAAALHPENTQIWFSVGDSPISWLYPAGVVKDYVNECTREARLAQCTAVVTSFNPAQAAAASPTSLLPSAPSSVLVQSLPLSVVSEPLDLTFHIHSITKGSVRAGTVPLYVNYDRLEEHIRMEIKQCHKAAYTCLYGNYTHYQREAESTLLPAIGLALYRPFDEVAQQKLQEQRLQAQGASGGSGGSIGSCGRYNSTASFSSQFLLLQYQQLLQGVLTPRLHVAYLIRVGVPYAYRGAISQFESGYLQYDSHRVSAAPALAWPFSPASPPTSQPQSASRAADTAGQTSESQTQADSPAPLVGAEQLPFGVLLWRLFRVPVLRWQARQAQHSERRSDALAETETQRTYQHLLRSLAAYYVDPPACATERLEEQEPLLAGTPADPPPWAAWEQNMSCAWLRDYERGDGGEKLGLPFLEDTGEVSAPSTPQRRICFEVQGIQPSLATPGSFLEAHLSSSDRAIFVTVQVLPSPLTARGSS
ncbi:hypothetical protein ABL78_0502 [Leptomonas seymouri]|uniref:Autophagy protein ATG5 UblA domain-containing protein n=1 Tax=Leptomonas seymouri TaxID=5684 RepID=A0A0N0P8W7_LEPSE|nr:hypothetical protein ABL78_0502 [Leptomonas seymouri]|eukprot:KPI90426.1 hypothetical protein ABL78_0502 [Leptomonas seymouri]